MNRFTASFKLNLFSMLYFIFVFPFYVTMFLMTPENDENSFKVKIFGLILFIPTLIVQIISIVYSAKTKFTNRNPKILLIFMDILFAIGPIVMLAAKKYFGKFLIINDDERTDKKIYKNTIINSVYIFSCLLFLIIYCILDATLKPTEQTAAEAFAFLFVSSIAFIIYEYLLMIFLIIYALEINAKQKAICCIPVYNTIYYKEINKLKCIRDEAKKYAIENTNI